MDKPTRERVLEFVAEFSEERGYSPSYEEIANGCGLASKSTVLHHLFTLRGEGRLDFVEHKPRTVHVLQQEQDSSNG